jgi:hypothetical protein
VNVPYSEYDDEAFGVAVFGDEDNPTASFEMSGSASITNNEGPGGGVLIRVTNYK